MSETNSTKSNESEDYEIVRESQKSSVQVAQGEHQIVELAREIDAQQEYLESRILIPNEAVPEPWEFSPKPKRPKGKFDFLPSTTFLIPSILVLLLCAFLTFFSWRGDFIDLSLSWNDLQLKGEFWRGFSALFLHSGLAHLLSNALGVLVFGWLLYGYFGVLAFPVLPVLFGVVSNYLTVFGYSPNVRLVGISGMLYGMIGLWLVLYLKFDTARKLPVKLVRVFAFSALMLIPTQYDAARSDLAHGLGFVSGIVSGVSFVPFAKLRSTLKGV